MLKNGLITVLALLVISGCGFFRSKNPPPPPEPTLVAVEFEADGDINPDAEGRPSPLVIRIYQLKYYDKFEDANYKALLQNDTEVLGREFIEKGEVILQPGEKKTELIKNVSDAVHTIAFMGQFRDENAQWRTGAGIQQNKTTVIKVRVSRTAIVSQLQVSPTN